MDYNEFNELLERKGLKDDPATQELSVLIEPIPKEFDALGLYFPDADPKYGVPAGTMWVPPEVAEKTVMHELGHRHGDFYYGEMSEEYAEAYRVGHMAQPRRPAMAPADYHINYWRITSFSTSPRQGDTRWANMEASVSDIYARWPDGWQVAITAETVYPDGTPTGLRLVYAFKSVLQAYATTISFLTRFYNMGIMPNRDIAVVFGLFANHDDSPGFGFDTWRQQGWEALDNKIVQLFSTSGTSGYVPVATSSSFDALASSLAASGGQLLSGDRVKFVMTLNQPYARAFDLVGAELLFRPQMPQGLILTDVHSDGDNTVVIEATATSPHFAAVGAFLAAHWVGLSLAAIGITGALGLLVASISFLVLTIKAPEKIADVANMAKWIAIGLGAVAVGGIAYSVSKSKRQFVT